MSKYLELFKGAFDDSISTKTKPENKPYIGYSLTDGIAYTVVPKPEEPDPIVGIDYLCLEPLGDNNELTVIIWDNKNVDIHYSFDKITWNTFPGNFNYIPVNKPIYLKGNNSKLEDSTLHLGGKGKYNVSGDITTLLNEVGGVEDLTPYGRREVFGRLFGDDEWTGAVPPIVDVVDASKLKLPSTILGEACYLSMFSNCGSLISAPKLPATTLVDECYYTMFMWCPNLKNVTCLATDISAYDCTSEWLLDVPSTGTFVKHPDMNGWSTGASGIPSGWTVVDAEL